MTRKKSQMETVLGVHIAQRDEREIPGLNKKSESKVLYFLVIDGQETRSLFKKITTFSNPLNAQSGGVHEGGCIIITPKNDKFSALRFRGDLTGWQKDIELGAAAIGSELASIENGNLVVFDGRSYSLAECKIEFT